MGVPIPKLAPNVTEDLERRWMPIETQAEMDCLLL